MPAGNPTYCQDLGGCAERKHVHASLQERPVSFSAQSFWLLIGIGTAVRSLGFNVMIPGHTHCRAAAPRGVGSGFGASGVRRCEQRRRSTGSMHIPCT